MSDLMKWELEKRINLEQAARVKTTKDYEFGLKNLLTKPVLGANDHLACFKNHRKLMSNVEERNQEVPQQE